MSEQDQHQAVLLEEAVKGLAMIPEGIYIDGTFGRGGHSQRLLASLSDKGRLFAIDKDPEAVAVAHKKFTDDVRFSITQTSFANLKTLAEKNNVLGKVNGVLLDLGVSSPQLDSAERGFSFTKTGPLDMRMDPNSGIDAATWINSAPEAKIAEVLKTYGEERFAKRIAKAIVNARQQQTISTTTQLAEIVKAANPKWEKHKHPATRTFQAIRIFINEELSDLETCLDQCLEVLAIGGRLSVISFHSLEDRIVKRFINHHAKAPQVPKSLPIPTEQLPISLRKIGKAIKASEQEVKNNPRARSAVLRVAEKIA